ncbi:MAG: carboxypeptidase regulatory-like domain-containing protein [Bacteroidota bacterium]|jgi:outer membrane protein OmpA-like peptidoglycan-associated protein
MNQNFPMKKALITISILFSFQAFCQTRLEKKANEDYSAYNYEKSVKEYEAVKIKSDKDLRELADGYRKLHQYNKSENWYAQLLATGKGNQNDSIAFISVLMNNQKYNESSELMKKYKESHKNDNRFDVYLSDENYIKKIAGENRFTISDLEINSEQEDFGAVYFKDIVVFTSSREGIKPVQRRWNWNHLPFLDIYSAKKNEKGELSDLKPFQKSLNKKFHEGPVCFNKAGNIAVFTRDNYKEKSSENIIKLQIVICENKNGKWIETAPFPYNNKEYSVGHAALNDEGNIMFFSSDMPGGKGGVDIYLTKRNSDGSWSKPENLGDKINTAGNEMFPSYHSSGLIFYSSDGNAGLGGLDIFVAQYKNEKVGKVLNVGAPVNSSKDDFSFVLDEIQKSGYFASNREGGKGDDDIYSFNLLKPFNFGKTIKGKAKDKDGNLLAGTNIQLKDNNGNVIGEVTTDDSGNFSFSIDDENSFQLNGKKDGFNPGMSSVKTNTDQSEYNVDVVLEKTPKISLYALITDSKSKEPIEGVKITITTSSGSPVGEFSTSSSGEFSKNLDGNKVGDQLNYNVKIEKLGYLTKTVTFTKTIDKPGQINLHEYLDVSLGKLEIGGDLAKMIDVKPIYFDLGKYNIRKDAAVELDKIIKVMNDYPTMVIELGSHTDCRSSAESNMKLSDNRAKSSAEYIKKKITNPDRITGKGYGETKLLNGCACEGNVKSTCSEEEHQKNRRTEFIIIHM